MTPPDPRRWSRRSVLAGLGALGLAACAKSSDGSSGRSGTDTETATQGAGALNLLSFFPSSGTVLAGQPQRLPFGLADGRGVPLEAVPDRLAVTVVDREGREVSPAREVAAHSEGLERAYYPVPVEVPEPGIYAVRSEVDGEPLEAAFQAGATSPLPQVGDPLPSVATPTFTDTRGVDPICTRRPMCPLHEVSLDEALGSGRPTVVLVSTPAFCQVAICGPVLEVLLGQRNDDATFIHTEVYASGEEARENLASAPLAPVMKAMGLPFEPALFIADGAGTLRYRFDSIYDQRELADALATISS